MSCPAANGDPFAGIIALFESFIILRLVDSRFHGERAVSALRICELLKFESVQISELTAHCDELPPQDGTLAACLMHLAFHRYFSVVSLS